MVKVLKFDVKNLYWSKNYCVEIIVYEILLYVNTFTVSVVIILSSYTLCFVCFLLSPAHAAIGG